MFCRWPVKIIFATYLPMSRYHIGESDLRSQTVENKGIEATTLTKLAGIGVQGGSPADSSHVKGLSEIDDAMGGYRLALSEILKNQFP